MGGLPKAVVKRLLTEQGGNLRVSGDALDAAVAAAEAYIGRLARAAQQSAESNKRKTMMPEDLSAARAQVG